MKLKLGEMTTDEIAKWFGISKKGYQNKRVKKLNELKNFAKFKEEKRGIIKIEEIYVEEYDKNLSGKYQKIKEEIPKTWSPNGLDTCKRVSEAIHDKYYSTYPLKESTYYQYTLKGRTELFGKPNRTFGTLGTCSYKWAKENNRQGIQETHNYYLPLTPEEEEIRKEVLEEVFGKGGHTIIDKVEYVQTLIEEKELSEAEAWRLLDEITDFNTLYKQFLDKFAERIGGAVRKTTYISYEKGEDINEE